MNDNNELITIDGLTLSEMYVPPARFCVDTLLPTGFTILGGAPKVGKSWMAPQLCIAVASGQPLWGLETDMATVLYLSLEDNLTRLQSRLNTVTEEPPERLFFATECSSLSGALCEQIRQFCFAHANTRLVVIDTLQVARGNSGEPTYASDYAAVRILKDLAEDLNISILALHHLRKQGDSDPMNRLSGTTGITGAADCTYVLERDARTVGNAILHCAGRDIHARKLELEFDEDTCTWKLISDSLKLPKETLPEDLQALVAYMKECRFYFGGNTQLAEILSQRLGKEISPRFLKQQMKRFRTLLSKKGVGFSSSRTSALRTVNIQYFPPNDEDDDHDNDPVPTDGSSPASHAS